MKGRYSKILSAYLVGALLACLLLPQQIVVEAAEDTKQEEADGEEMTETPDSKSEMTNLEGTIPEHISIAGTDVSGMDAAEAFKIVEAYVAKFDDVTFTLAADDKSVTANSEDIGLCAKNADVVERALRYGQEGNLIARYKARQDMAEGRQKDFDLTLTSNLATVEAFLEANKEHLVEEAVDNTVKRENGKFVYVEGSEGVKLLVGKSAIEIADYLATKWDGEDTTIPLLTQEDSPRGTKEELSSISDLLGGFSTNFGTVDNGRTRNIKAGAGKLNGTVVYPGETISVSETIGPTTAENGFFLAGSYENGTTVDTYGGGICQVSSTLYNAILRSELEVVTRSAHSMIVTYVEPSMDAAIADGIKDLQFKNNKETPIYIEGYTDNGNLFFNIYGKETRDPGRRIEFISEVTSQAEGEKEFVPVGDQPIGYIETTVKPHVGCTARLWKVVYENDVEVSRDVINNSKYNPSKEVIAVGVATDNPEAAAAMAAALETKDPVNILTTIANWTPEAIAARNQAAQQQAAPTAPIVQIPVEKPGGTGTASGDGTAGTGTTGGTTGTTGTDGTAPTGSGGNPETNGTQSQQ